MATKKSGRHPPQKRRKKQSFMSRQKVRKVTDRNNTLIGLVVVVILAIIAGAWIVFFRDVNPPFNGEHALEDIQTQVAFGPRIPGSEGHERTRAFLVETFERYAEQVGEQTFTYIDRHDTTHIVEGVNIVASFNLKPRKQKRVMLAAHWDTRPFADRDLTESNRSLPVPGANDGASGVAVLLEMARVFAAEPPDIGVDIILFDLEDMGDNSNDQSTEEAALDSVTVRNPFAIGSEYFAEHQPEYRPEYGVLLDMVCDANLRIPKEANSVRYARPIVDKVWAAANEVGASAFIDEQGQAIMDDHFAFLQRGIRVVDLIHWPFPSYWHTVRDTPDKCSAESLQQVGEVLVELIYNE